MEVVSPILNTRQQTVASTVSEFWEAMRVHFDVQRDASCGGHVHVTPEGVGRKFTLAELKKIAFATVVYEDYVRAVLPPGRRDNQYCRPNSRSTGRDGQACGLRAALSHGKTAHSLRAVAEGVKAAQGERQLATFMQKDRYVLWNYQNIYPDLVSGKHTGTVEFRGGSQFLDTKGTLAWVVFVLGFIALALKEVRNNLFRPRTHRKHGGIDDLV